MYRIVEKIEQGGVTYSYNSFARYHVKGSANDITFDFKDQFIWDTCLKKAIYIDILSDRINGIIQLFNLMRVCEGLNKENELYEKEIKDYGTL